MSRKPTFVCAFKPIAPRPSQGMPVVAPPVVVPSTKPRVSCAVPMCKNCNHTRPSMTFFAFPTDPDRVLRWLEIIKLDTTRTTGPLYICEAHFSIGEIKRNTRRKYLAPNAVPSLNLIFCSTVTTQTDPVIILPMPKESTPHTIRVHIMPLGTETVVVSLPEKPKVDNVQSLHTVELDDEPKSSKADIIRTHRQTGHEIQSNPVKEMTIAGNYQYSTEILNASVNKRLAPKELTVTRETKNIFKIQDNTSGSLPFPFYVIPEKQKSAETVVPSITGQEAMITLDDTVEDCSPIITNTTAKKFKGTITTNSEKLVPEKSVNIKSETDDLDKTKEEGRPNSSKIKSVTTNNFTDFQHNFEMFTNTLIEKEQHIRTYKKLRNKNDDETAEKCVDNNDKVEILDRDKTEKEEEKKIKQKLLEEALKSSIPTIKVEATDSFASSSDCIINLTDPDQTQATLPEKIKIETVIANLLSYNSQDNSEILQPLEGVQVKSEEFVQDIIQIDDVDVKSEYMTIDEDPISSQYEYIVASDNSEGDEELNIVLEKTNNGGLVIRKSSFQP